MQYHRTVPFDAILGGGERSLALLPSIEAVTDADRAFVRALLVNSGGRLGRLGCPSGDQGDAEER